MQFIPSFEFVHLIPVSRIYIAQDKGYIDQGGLYNVLRCRMPVIQDEHAKVAELVDALDLGSSRATCESSSLSSRTKLSKAVMAKPDTPNPMFEVENASYCRKCERTRPSYDGNS